VRRAWQPLLLLLLVFAAYWPAWSGGFIWDDLTFIVNNDLIHAPNGLLQIWFSKGATDYWPVSYSLFWFLWRLFGGNPIGYHLVNLLIHASNAILVFKILARLGFRWAYLAALLFVLHPVCVEAVAWIFQIKTTLAVLFCLSSFWFWILTYEGHRRALWVALFLFVCALLTKTSVVTWPAIMLGFVWWRTGGVKTRDLLRAAPFFAASLVAGLNGLFWYSYNLLHDSQRVRVEPFAERVASAGITFWFYLSKVFWPHPLVFVYPRWTVSGSVDYLPALLAVGFIVALFVWRRRSTTLLAVGFFTIAIFPVLGFFDIYYMRFSYVADHWQYLALIGVIVWLAAHTRYAGYVIAAVLFGLTFHQAGLYANEETLWRDTLAKNPGAWLAENRLAVTLLQSGRADEAVFHLQKLVREHPDFDEPYLNLGVIELGRGHDTEAVAYFQKVLEVFPGNVRALNNLATIAVRQGHNFEAEAQLREAVENLPTYALAWKNLGIVYLHLGRKADAVHALQRALELRADDAEAAQYLREAMMTH